MIIIVSGEGPADIGSCRNGQGTCSDADFQPGPMTWLANKLAGNHLGYAPLEFHGCVRFVSEQYLADEAASRRNNKRNVSLTGKKLGQETGYFHNNAWVLGRVAQGMEDQENDDSVAVLFRDCDSTRSAKNGDWDRKRQSMLSGFTRAKYDHGIPMIPLPKSEAWLLCAAKANPYQNCDQLEALSGNDASPNAVKKKLDAALGMHLNTLEWVEWLDEKGFNDVLACDMPSFKAFCDRLFEVLISVAAH